MAQHTRTPLLQVVVPQVETLIAIRGQVTPTEATAGAAATAAGATVPGAAVGVVLKGLTFAHTTSTFMDTYEVPSGGDWWVFDMAFALQLLIIVCANHESCSWPL